MESEFVRMACGHLTELNSAVKEFNEALREEARYMYCVSCVRERFKGFGAKEQAQDAE